MTLLSGQKVKNKRIERYDWVKPIFDYYEAKRKYENSIDKLFIVTYFLMVLGYVTFIFWWLL